MARFGDQRCVVVLHEVWGPDANTELACKRLRKLGFSTVAPSLYRGYEALLTEQNIRKAMKVVWGLSLAERHDRRKVAAEAARKNADSTELEVLSVLYDQEFRSRMIEITMDAVREARTDHGQVGTLGFSLGGGLSLLSATKIGHPDSAVAYCGEPPGAQSLGPGAAPMLAICASDDELMNPLMPEFTGAALERGVDLTVKTFPNTRHDFFNSTMKDRYNRDAAAEAWDITVWFLTRTLLQSPHSKR